MSNAPSADEWVVRCGRWCGVAWNMTARRLSCVVAWPMLWVVDAAMVATGQGKWHALRGMSRRAVVNAWNKRA